MERLGNPLTIRFSKDQRRELEKRASDSNTDLASIVRLAVSVFLAQNYTVRISNSTEGENNAS